LISAWRSAGSDPCSSVGHLRLSCLPSSCGRVSAPGVAAAQWTQISDTTELGWLGAGRPKQVLVFVMVITVGLITH
jgi:hypothetical protein